MSGHRRHRRRRSSDSWLSGSSRSTSRISKRASTTETVDDVHGGGHRRLKRSSASSPVRWRSLASSRHRRSWVLLNQGGARRRDRFPGDSTTSAMSCTSKGEEISVSFELVQPPGTSILTVDWLPASRTPGRKVSGNVIAAHRDVVLLAITSYYENIFQPETVVDLFVYQASHHDDDPSRRWPPSLLLLPSAGRPMIYSQSIKSNQEIGIMSCPSNDDDSPTSFVVAELRMTYEGTSNVTVFQPESGQWESFENLHVRGANGGRDLRSWSTDTVVPYGRRYLVFSDYYRGMVLMDMYQLLLSSSDKNNLPPPVLRYVPLPVDTVEDPADNELGSRGCPRVSRRVCVTHDGIKFVSVDTQHWSNFGVGHQDVLKWHQRFRITTWSLREHDYTWRKDLTMHEEEFWDAFDHQDYRFRFPHAQPKFPVVDMDNPDVVFFRLENSFSDHGPKWMIEVDLRKKVLLAATAYSKKRSDGLSADAQAINSARVSRYDPIPSELPRYFDLDGGQACKRRRQ